MIRATLANVTGGKEYDTVYVRRRERAALMLG